MPAPIRFLLFALLALAVTACQSHGRVHETPPRQPRHPAPEHAEPGRHADPRSDSSEPWGWGEPSDRGPAESGGAFVEPPAAPEPSAPRAARRGTSDEREEGAASEAARRQSQRYSPQPRERPGLATHWGETRYSPAREVDFERASPERPVAAYQIHYNDREGARRMLPGGHWGTSELVALGGDVRLSMVNARGEPFSALRHGSRVVVIGQPSERYALLIQNRSGERFEVVASVDGLDVLDGEDGSLDKRGYLVAPYSSVLIDGFRQSGEEVAAFRLGDVARSYAASKGKARNVGVIGFALFDERNPEPYYRRPYPRWRDDTNTRRSADPFPGNYAKPPAW